MQHRWRARLEMAVALACLVGCASAPHRASAPPEASAPEQARTATAGHPPAQHAPAQHPTAEPGGLLVPQTLTLRGPATLSSVSGTCYVVRGEGGVIAQQGAVLQDGDVLDLGNAEDNGSVAIHATGKSDIVLRRSMGRFFKLQIRP